MQRKNGVWTAPARRRPSQTGPDSFCFLNRNGDLSAGWDNPDLDKLWCYNLHYFDDLNAEGAQARVQWHLALIDRWMKENPPASGSGWEPYPTSLRIVNWVKWALAGNVFSEGAVQSLAVQARWLMRRLEYHLLGNHLFANAKALVFAGCFFAGEEAENWLSTGLNILAHEVPEQILADGGHFELSTLYHALALEDMLDLVNVMRSADLSVPVLWENKISDMRHWLAAMCHPDGEISFFNDAAIGIAPSPEELEHYAVRLDFPAHAGIFDACTWLKDSGYVRLQNDRAVLLIDVARIGPDYLPGHAHADTLSFELSLDGQRIIVNSGTSVYGTGPERQRQRGTTAHNTVVVADENSSEVWSGFRVARRARPRDLSIERENDSYIVACAHDGYRRLEGGPLHRRHWAFGEKEFVVSDFVSGVGHRARAAFHFHPHCRLTLAQDGQSGFVFAGQDKVLHWQLRTGTAHLENASWHPEFGCCEPTQRLVVTLVEGRSIIVFGWVSDR
ncbi:heparinase II/III family protein [Aquamicrobium segne]|uniref:heparinase II/III family protein n=1 Tax=Aquamicrobium segne TaxID=469547 RepID=UPI00366F7F4E